MSLYFNQAKPWRYVNMCDGGQGRWWGHSGRGRGQALGYFCGYRSHLLGHLVDPGGGAVTQVGTPWVPHDLLGQAPERSDT